MDYYHFNSEVAENLAFLRSPVQKGVSAESTSIPVTPDFNRNLHNEQLIKDFRTKVTKRKQQRNFEETDSGSSASLILKKTTEKEVLEQYSLLTQKNIHLNLPPAKPNCDRPLIKVRVIPNNKTQTQTHKLGKRTLKKVQSTVSNQENSIKAKIYLVVAGRRREKIYKIKTTGSAQISNNTKDKDEPVPIDEVSNLKQLLSSLNMDKKKKGKKKLGESPSTRDNDDDFEETNITLPEGSKVPRSNMSRVRITGRIGLTENDRYVMRCNATVDDKPVGTHYAQLDQTVFKNKEQPLTNRRQNDTDVQTGYGCEFRKTFKGPSTLWMNFHSNKESQATQTNLNTVCLSNVDALKIFSKNDQTVRCCSKAGNGVNISEMENEASDNSSSSPLVIISVYPKQEVTDTNKIQKPSSKNIKPRLTGKPKPDINSNKNAIKSPRARSPSPVKITPKSRTENMQSGINSTVNRANVTTGNTNVNTKIKKDNNKQATVITNIKTEQTKAVPKDRLITENRKREPRVVSPPKVSPERKKNVSALRTQQRLRTQGTNTDHLLTKKALVDTYTKKLTEQMRNNKVKNSGRDAAQNKVSNISVNVDAENEYYDFLFCQGGLTTDLRIRKTLKDGVSQKNNFNDTRRDNANESTSLENFLLLTDGGSKKRSFSQTFLFDDDSDKTNDDILLKKLSSRLTVRDSLEIFHRREERNSVGGTKLFQVKTYDKCSDSLKEAPIKHYRGDSCSILDPVHRDKEIRKLLGIEKTKPATSRSRMKKKSTHVKEDYSLIHYLFPLDHSQIGAERGDKLCRACGCNTREYVFDNQGAMQSDSNTSQFKISPAPEMQTFELSSEQFFQPPRDFHNKIHQPNHHSVPQPSQQTAVEKNTLHQPPLYQQLILNRNVNVYLQIEQFRKKKPIILSRQQYDKVKRAIDNVTMKRDTMCIYKKYSSLSIGKVRKKPRLNPTENKSNLRKRKEYLDSSSLNIHRAPASTLKKDNDEKEAKRDAITLCECCKDDKDREKENPYEPFQNEKYQTHKAKHFTKNHVQQTEDTSYHCPCCGKIQNAQTNYCSFCGMAQHTSESKEQFCVPKEDPYSSKNRFRGSGHAPSSMEICYTSVAYTKRVTFSSTNVEASASVPCINDQSTNENDVHRADSIFTIFKAGRKKPHTPNLGTSVYSVFSDCSLQTPEIEMPSEPKPRKPFLRRLMSCLVMRSARASAAKIRPAPEVASVDSSIDSYHISTSLGAIELSSSIYDTSASFYSSHAIMPVNSKMKRGFLGSMMRGLLISRKS